MPQSVPLLMAYCFTAQGAGDKIMPANEARFDARAKLGRLLTKMEKRPGTRTD